MNIRILGAHSGESKDSRCACLLVDNALALDAGALTSNLSLTEQQELKAILITHQHYDHIRDIPSIVINHFFQNSATSIYSTQPVFDALRDYILNDELYPRFLEIPEFNPAAEFTIIEPYQNLDIDSYSIIAVPVNHEEAAVGYQIAGADGKTFFYTGDTGPGLAKCWESISPQLLFIDVTLPNEYRESATQWGHLTPALLNEELVSFNKIKGYLPRIMVVHMNPVFEEEIKSEIKAVASELAVPITIASEGMEVSL